MLDAWTVSMCANNLQFNIEKQKFHFEWIK